MLATQAQASRGFQLFEQLTEQDQAMASIANKKARPNLIISLDPGSVQSLREREITF